MYNSDKTASIIKLTAKQKGVAIGQMLTDCGLNRDSISLMSRRGSWLQSNNLAKIADYLDCSVDYLLNRTDNPTSHRSSISVSANNVLGNGAIGVGNTVTNGTEIMDEQTAEMLHIYKKLSPLNKAKLLIYADELVEN